MFKLQTLVVVLAITVIASAFKSFVPSPRLSLSSPALPIPLACLGNQFTQANRNTDLKMSSSDIAINIETRNKPESSLWKLYLKTTDLLTVLFPLWTVLFAGIALVRPSSFSWFSTKYFTASLAALMLSMGITLTPDDFTRVSQQPGAVIVGFILCYVMSPLLGLGLGQGFKLPIDLVAGLVLVGSINGGQASNLCTYIAKGDVALSVLMTTVTTIAGIVATPFLCKLLLGAVVPVDAV